MQKHLFHFVFCFCYDYRGNLCFHCFRNRTIKVTGFSLQTAIRQKLADLFSRGTYSSFKKHFQDSSSCAVDHKFFEQSLWVVDQYVIYICTHVYNMLSMAP